MRRPPILSFISRYQLTSRWAFVTAGLAAGFSGLAIIATILTGVPLLIFEAALSLVPLGAAVILIRRTPRPIVREIWRVVRAGFVVGFAATLLYDLTRTTLSYFDPSPYNPFEAIRLFGLGMVSADAPIALIMAAGFAIHFLNGSSFGVIYAALGGRHVRTMRAAVIGGIAWGLTLEITQSMLYPGWLQIPTVVMTEFLVITGLGHVAYGASLGIGVRWLLLRGRADEEGDDRFATP